MNSTNFKFKEKTKLFLTTNCKPKPSKTSNLTFNLLSICMLMVFGLNLVSAQEEVSQDEYKAFTAGAHIKEHALVAWVCSASRRYDSYQLGV